MSNELVIDNRTGLCTNYVSARIVNDDIVFTLGDAPERSPYAIDKLESEDVAAVFAGLVVGREGARVRGDGLPGASMADPVVRKKEGPQYRLVDETCGELLVLAQRIGPLFGLFGGEVDARAGGEYRESIASWIQAAGVLRLAARLKDIVTERRDYDVLDDEVVFYAAIDAKENVFYRLADQGPSNQLYLAAYAKDEAFLPAYERMLSYHENQRPRVFPTVLGKQSEASTYVSSNYGIFDLEKIKVMDIDDFMAKSFVASFEVFNGWRLSPVMENFLACELKRSAGNRCARIAVDPDELDPIAEKMVFAYGAKSDEGLSQGDAASAFLESASLSDNRALILFGNDSLQIDELSRLSLYRYLFDALMRLHTWTCSLDYSAANEHLPFYSCALQHLWCILGKKGESGRMAFCPECGKLVPRSGRGPAVGKPYRLCGDRSCKSSYSNRWRRRRNNAIDNIVLHFMESRFTTGNLIDYLEFVGIKSERATVEKRLRVLCEAKRGKRPRLRSLGGNGRGQRWELLD